MGAGRDQIPEIASAQSQERRKRRRLGNETLSKTVIAKHCLTLEYVNMDEENVSVDGNSGDVLGLRLSGKWPCPEVSWQRAAATEATAGFAAAAARIGRLLWMATHCSDRPRKVQSGRAHASSSTGTSSQSAPNASVAQNSRQVFYQNIMKVRRWHSQGIARQCHVVQWHGRAPRER